MNALFQLLSEDDLKNFTGLMREFYSDQHLPFDQSVALSGLQKLITTPGLGEAYLIFLGSEAAGYFVLTFCFSLEFHGRFALLDELYVRPQFRRQKLAKAAIEFAEKVCRAKHIKALRLEVGEENQAGLELYRGTGFSQENRRLFTRWL